MTGSAAALEDLGRWVGVLIAIWGALLANPDATTHSWATFLLWLRSKWDKARGWLAKYIPWLCKSVDGQVKSGVAIPSIAWSGTVRGPTPLPVRGTLDEKVQILDERTKRLHEEVWEIQRSLHKTEKQLRSEFNAVQAGLREEARKIQHGVETFQSEMIHSDASALPIIVAGLALTGLAPDAESVPLLAGLLLLLSVVVFVGVRSYVVLRDWRSKDPEKEYQSDGT